MKIRGFQKCKIHSCSLKGFRITACQSWCKSGPAMIQVYIAMQATDCYYVHFWNPNQRRPMNCYYNKGCNNVGYIKNSSNKNDIKIHRPYVIAIVCWQWKQIRALKTLSQNLQENRKFSAQFATKWFMK